MSEAIAEIEPEVTPEVSDDDAMQAIWDKHQKADEPEPEPEVEPEADNKPEAADKTDETEEAEAVEEAPKAPKDIPLALSKIWGELPEAARDIILEDRNAMSQKLATLGRAYPGMAPIKEVLDQAVQEIPGLSDMPPKQVAAEVFELAKMQGQFRSDPVKAMMGLIEKHGIGQHIAQALMGNVPEAAQTHQELQEMRRMVQQVSSPEFLRQNFEQLSAETRAVSEVEQFAAKAEHWADVEPLVAKFLPAVQEQNPDASSQDVLQAAYDLALQLAKPSALVAPVEETAAHTPDPSKTAKAKAAKAINVPRGESGKFRERSVDEELQAIWDKYNS